MDTEFWDGKKVLITGHTGFKGSWLSLWLKKLNSKVFGYSKNIPTEPSLFKLAGIENEINSNFGDIQDLKTLKNLVFDIKPDIIFHMAAQSLVRESYSNPVETYLTNVMGTVNILESVKELSKKCIIVNITSDKCYENLELKRGYTEDDRLGGFDPYSSSKGCAEIISTAYNRSFLSKDENSKILSSVRAGNVIGGGDWAKDRLIPDLIKGSFKKNIIKIRNHNAVRPWQFVLEPLNGYLILAQKMWESGSEYSGPWNFGPDNIKSRKVSEVIGIFTKEFKELKIEKINDDKEETNMLLLDSTKSNTKLNWKSKLSFEETMEWTINWYKKYQLNENMKKITEEQIETFESL